MSSGAYVICHRASSFQKRTESRKWPGTAFESMFPSLKVTDCQSSNLSQAWTAFEVKTVLSWKVGIMPFTLGVRFPFHLICYLAKEAFALACLSLYILGIPEPASRWLCNKHGTPHRQPSLPHSVLRGVLSREAWRLGWGYVAYCFLSLKSFCPLFFVWEDLSSSSGFCFIMPPANQEA